MPEIIGTAQAASQISIDLLGAIRRLLLAAVDEFDAERGTLRGGPNWHTQHGFAGYIVAGAALEAYINEFFLSELARMLLPSETLDRLGLEEELERLDLRTKVTLLPELRFGKSLRRDAQPYQDMTTLVKMRNDLAHYKMPYSPPKYLRDLQQRGIALNGPGDEAYGWAYVISTAEGIRWAYNTVCSVIGKLGELMPDTAKAAKVLAAHASRTIPDGWLVEQLKARGVELPPKE